MAIKPTINTTSSQSLKDAQISQNFQEIANKERTDVKKDENGIPNILIGYQDGGFGTEDYGIKVSQQGVDVRDATDDQLVMSSAFNMFKIVQSGEVTLTTSGTSPRTASTTVTHNLGYSPVVIGSVQVSSGLSNEVVAFPGQYYVHDGTNFRARAIFEYFAADNNEVTIQVREDIGSGDWKIQYYILAETGAD